MFTTPDVVIICTVRRVRMSSSLTPAQCPLCFKYFPAKDVEQHAGRCNGDTTSSGGGEGDGPPLKKGQEGGRIVSEGTCKGNKRSSFESGRSEINDTQWFE